MPFFLSLLLWFLAGALLVAGVSAGARLYAARRNRGGFMDFVKNPDRWDDVNKMFEEIEKEIQASKSWNDEKVALVTDWVIFEAESDTSYRRVLNELNGRPHATVLRILSDPDLHDRLVSPKEGESSSNREYPVCRAFDLLGDFPPPAALAAAVPFLSEPEPTIRKNAAWLIGKTGLVLSVPHLQRVFQQEPDEDVCEYALMGLAFAFKKNGLPPAAAAGLFPDVLGLLQSERWRFPPSSACNVLFCIDPDRATKFFLSPPAFSADSSLIAKSLKTLAEGKVMVPRDQLLTLVASLEAGSLEYPRDYACEEALQLLGRHRHPEDREFLMARLEHPNREVASGATLGLQAWHGIEGFARRIWRRDYASLTENQRHYRAAFICNGEVNNGGFAQFFMNSSGQFWKDALAGFEAMGFRKKTQALRTAAALFGEAGPPLDRSLRMEQLGRLCRKDEKIFKPMDTDYYGCDGLPLEDFDVVATRFAIAHADEFDETALPVPEGTKKASP